MKPSVMHPLSGVSNHIKDKVDVLVRPLTGVVFTPGLIQTVGAFCFETGDSCNWRMSVFVILRLFRSASYEPG
jgi:hypothetical protein